MNDNVIDVSKFYSKDNEENGVWYEIKVRGVGTNIEAKLYGPNSKAASVAWEKYQKALDEISKIEDAGAKSEAKDMALVEYATALVSDIRGKGDFKLVNKDGTPFTVRDVKTMLYNAPVMASDIAKFQGNQNNFLSN